MLSFSLTWKILVENSVIYIHERKVSGKLLERLWTLKWSQSMIILAMLKLSHSTCFVPDHKLLGFESMSMLQILSLKAWMNDFFFSFYSLRANSEWIWYGWGDGNIVITFIMTFYGDFSVELVGCVIEYRLFASQVILGWGATIAIRFELFAHFRYAPNIFRVGMVNGKEIVRVTHYSHLHMEHRFG